MGGIEELIDREIRQALDDAYCTDDGVCSKHTIFRPMVFLNSLYPIINKYYNIRGMEKGEE